MATLSVFRSIINVLVALSVFGVSILHWGLKLCNHAFWCSTLLGEKGHIAHVSVLKSIFHNDLVVYKHTYSSQKTQVYTKCMYSIKTMSHSVLIFPTAIVLACFWIGVGLLVCGVSVFFSQWHTFRSNISNALNFIDVCIIKYMLVA